MKSKFSHGAAHSHSYKCALSLVNLLLVYANHKIGDGRSLTSSFVMWTLMTDQNWQMHHDADLSLFFGALGVFVDFTCNFELKGILSCMESFKVKIYDTPAGGIHASQGNFSSYCSSGTKYLPQIQLSCMDKKLGSLFLSSSTLQEMCCGFLLSREMWYRKSVLPGTGAG